VRHWPTTLGAVILVTGATGRTGQHIVDHLLAHGLDVRILVRETSIVPDRWSLERSTGDLSDATSVRRALSSVDAVFVLSPMDPLLDEREQFIFDAAADAGVRHVVKLSTTKPEPDSPIPWWRAHWRAEQALAAGTVPWTILRPNGISFFLLGHAQSVRETSVFRTAGGDGGMALIDADDIGAVAAAVFANPDRYVGRVLDLTGPTALSYGEVANLLTKVTGRRVAHLDVAPEDAREAMRARGVEEWEAEGVVANWLMTRDGSGGFDRVTDEVEQITGNAPLDLEVFLAAHRDDFQPGT
jgi:NAD(P)H dehydrogenase (quinone)